MGQWTGAVSQGCSRREHGVDGFQVPVALPRVRGDPHLIVVATFEHLHGDGVQEERPHGETPHSMRVYVPSPIRP